MPGSLGSAPSLPHLMAPPQSSQPVFQEHLGSYGGARGPRSKLPGVGGVRAERAVSIFQNRGRVALKALALESERKALVHVCM